MINDLRVMLANVSRISPLWDTCAKAIHAINEHEVTSSQMSSRGWPTSHYLDIYQSRHDAMKKKSRIAFGMVETLQSMISGGEDSRIFGGTVTTKKETIFYFLDELKKNIVGCFIIPNEQSV